MYNHGCYNSWDSNSVEEKTSLIVKIGEFFYIVLLSPSFLVRIPTVHIKYHA